MPTDEALWYGMANEPAKADPLAEARKKAQEEDEAAAKAEEEEFKQKTADILRGPKAAAKSLVKSAAMIAGDPMGAHPEATAEVVERGAEYLGKGYDYLKEKISPEEVVGPAAAIAAFDPELFRGSKITTETGEPLTVYHGAPPSWDAEGRAVPRSFRDFDPSMFGHQYGQRFGPGIYFSTAPATASRYAAQMPTEAYFPEGSDLPEMRHPALSPERDPEGFTRVKDSGDRKMGGSVLRAAVTIKNPYDWPSSGDRAVGGLHGLVVERERLPDDIHDAVVARAGFDPSRKTNWKLHPKFEDLYVPSGTPRTHTTNIDEIHLEERAMQIMGDALKEELTSRGHDGIRITQPTYGHRYVRDPEWRLDETGELRQVEPSKVAPTQEVYRTGTEQEIVAFHPEQVRQAPRAAAPRAPVESLFTEQALKQARTDAFPKYKNRNLLIYLTPEEFLGLARQGASPSSEGHVRSMIEAGERFDDLPHLQMDDSGQIVDHEGRHRARELRRLGYDRMPVLLKARTIRWSEQAEGNRGRFGSDYQELPKQLIGEEGTFRVDSPFHTEGELRGQPLESRDPRTVSRAAAPEAPRAADTADHLTDLGGNAPKLNPDGTITLYHRTTPEAANEIRRTGRFTSRENTREVFLSNQPQGQGSGYGTEIIEVRVNPTDVRIDDVFDNEVHVAVKQSVAETGLRAAEPKAPSTGRPKRGGAGTVGTVGGLAALAVSGALAAQAVRGAVPEEVRESGVEAFYRFKGGKPVEARELDPRSKAVQAFVESEEALQWALQNNRISEDAYKQLSSLRK